MSARKSTVVAVCVAVLVVLSGCSLPIVGGGGGGGTTTEDAYPPGVSASGLDSAQALLSAHRSALQESGFRSRSTATTGSVDGGRIGPATQNTTAAAEAGGTPFRRYRNNSGGLSRDYETTIWGNGSVAVKRYTSYAPYGNGTPEYGTRPNVDPRGTPMWGLFLLQEFLRNGTFEVTKESDGRVTLELVGYEGPPDVENVSGTLVVDGEGRIRSAEVYFEQVHEGQRLFSTLEYELLKVGDVDVERPDWVGRALAAGEG